MSLDDIYGEGDHVWRPHAITSSICRVLIWRVHPHTLTTIHGLRDLCDDFIHHLTFQINLLILAVQQTEIK